MKIICIQEVFYRKNQKNKKLPEYKIVLERNFY